MPAPDQEPLSVGALSPDFDLEATGGRRMVLSRLLDRGPVALFFYPGNDTPG